MPAINPALLAQGGNVLDAQKLLTGAQRFKANELLLQQAPIEQARAAAAEERTVTEFGQSQADRVNSELVRVSNEFLNIHEQGGKESALKYLSGVTSSSQEILQIRDEAVAALNTPDPQDDINVLAQARGLVAAHTEQGKELGSAAMQDFNAVKNMSPEDRALWFQNKRAVKTLLVGGVPHVMVGNDAYPVNSPKGQATLQGEVDAKAALAKAAEEGKAAGIVETAEDVAVAQTEAKEVAGRPAEQEAALSQINDINNIFQEIDVAKENIGFFSTGRIGQGFALIAPGMTEAGVLEGTLGTIRANLGLEAMAKLKRLSSSGSTGMGNQSDREFAALQDSMTSLEQKHSPEELRRRLNKVSVNLTRIKRSMELKIRLQNGEISLEDARAMNRDIFTAPTPTGRTGVMPDGRKTYESEDGTWLYSDTEEPIQ